MYLSIKFNNIQYLIISHWNPVTYKVLEVPEKYQVNSYEGKEESYGKV